MKKILMLIFLLFILISFGCEKIDAIELTPSVESTQTAIPKPKPTPAPSTFSPTQSPTSTLSPMLNEQSDSDIEGATIVNIDIENIVVLENDITLNQINSIINMGLNETLDIFDEEYIMGANGYSSYTFEKAGIRILQYHLAGKEDESVDEVECDSNKLRFLDISKNMKFDDIMQILGQAEVIETDNRLGLNEYEIRYLLNGIKLKFKAWNSEGKNFQVSIVRNFNTSFKFIRISTDLIKELFNTTLLQFEEIYKEHFILDSLGYYYTLFGNILGFNEKGHLVYISFDNNYEVAGIRYTYNLKEVMKILGEREIEIDLAEDPIYSLNYEYDNFNIEYLTIWESTSSLWEINVTSNKFN